ncbi:hypothetical protein [Thaumasiovibrio subtropicus]|uniref:hypothetical protein n=1 Tax=Thaumasiovibrio subtropicus TaxID=1891207 RepID=UPI00131B494A|nr:hypothetical protein [Thaumasiovibrio subtropicus]
MSNWEQWVNTSAKTRTRRSESEISNQQKRVKQKRKRDHGEDFLYFDTLVMSKR